MQDVTAGVPNGTSGQNLNVQRMDHIADFDFKLAYADFHVNNRNKELNVEGANGDADAAQGFLLFSFAAWNEEKPLSKGLAGSIFYAWNSITITDIQSNSRNVKEKWIKNFFKGRSNTRITIVIF